MLRRMREPAIAANVPQPRDGAVTITPNYWYRRDSASVMASLVMMRSTIMLMLQSSDHVCLSKEEKPDPSTIPYPAFIGSA